MIGRPFDNVRAYVLGRGGQPVPVGAPGEIHVASPGLARGYTGRAALTAEVFVPDPYAGLFGEPGGRVYRTGDLGRRLADGALEFCGRVDQQLKLRGFRIEPGEIEDALRRHPSVQEAAVALRGGAEGDRRLIAWLAPARSEAPDGGAPAGLDSRVLREHLRSLLPEHMVPAAFVALPALPRLPNGKVDRKALPDPGRTATGTGGAGAYAPPRTDLEVRVAALWQELLGVERVGLHDNFFDLGGHSLLMVRMQARLEALGWDLGVAELFRHPTVAALAVRLEQGDGAAGHRERAHRRVDRLREAGGPDDDRRREAARLRRRKQG